jgi:hypothetical protein
VNFGNRDLFICLTDYTDLYITAGQIDVLAEMTIIRSRLIGHSDKRSVLIYQTYTRRLEFLDYAHDDETLRLDRAS